MLNKVSEETVNQALCTYVAKGTRYLKNSFIECLGKDKVRLKAIFGISESCYLSPSSGHFNAVEALICFNQMLYVALLGGIEKKYFSFYSHISPQDFNQHRRSVYILEFERVKFKKQVNNFYFYGSFVLEKLKTIGDKMYADCRCCSVNEEDTADFSRLLKYPYLLCGIKMPDNRRLSVGCWE